MSLETRTASDIPRVNQVGLWVESVAPTDFEFWSERTQSFVAIADPAAATTALPSIHGTVQSSQFYSRLYDLVLAQNLQISARSPLALYGLETWQRTPATRSNITDPAFYRPHGSFFGRSRRLYDAFAPVGASLFLNPGELDWATPVTKPFSRLPGMPSGIVSVEERFRWAFQRASELRFEDGMESDFSRELEWLIKTYGAQSRNALLDLLSDEKMGPDVLEEALRWIGRIDDQASHQVRLSVLERGLTSTIAIVRDGALLGLASMDDPKAIPALERAIASEKIPELRIDMEEVLQQLKNL